MDETSGVAKEIGETTRGFIHVMRENPLSLALVVMNFLLVGYLFYSGGQMLGQRKETTELIVTWQKQTDTLMANCVSHDVTKTMLDNMQKITETMLGAAQKDLERMQKAIEAERGRTDKLLDQAVPRPREQRSRVFRNVDGYIRQMYIGLRH